MQQQNAASGHDPMIECKGVWKVFGRKADEAIEGIRDGRMTKAEALSRFGCSVGVADATLSVARGEIFCIMGLSGSGKSTLLRHINRLIEPTRGEISIAGQRIDQMSAAELRYLRNHMIGMVFQHVALLPHRTVVENTAFGLEARGIARSERRRLAMEKLELVGLGHWADHLPRELSGGMQQRVGLARALTSDPAILLLDEPFSALDPVIRRDLQDQFLSITRSMQKTAVFITHDLEEAMKLGNRVAIMRDARIVQVGRPEEILFSPADDYVRDFVRGTLRHPGRKSASPELIALGVDRIRRLRDLAGDSVRIAIDLCAAVAPADLLRFARQIEDCGIEWLEEAGDPADPGAFTAIAAGTPIPLAAGERFFGLAGFRDLIASRAVSVLQPDLGTCGGFSEFQQIAALANSYSHKISPHNCGGAVLTAASLQMAACTANFLALETFPYFRDQPGYVGLTLFDPLDRISQGHIAVDRTPGLGVQADHAAIAPFLFAECPAPRPGNR